MAITLCPVCRKKISTRAPRCPHCHEDVSGNEPELASRHRSQQRKKSNAMKIQLALAMTLLVVCIGLILLEMNQGKPLLSPRYIAIGLAAAVWYVVTRLRIFLSHR